MVAQRRFGPLIAVVFAALGVAVARMFQVQVLEHEVWAQQAAGLVRSAKVLPSHRGSILDRDGKVLVRDEDVYEVEFRYRDFRRGHPLGMLAHARSSLTASCVTLREAVERRAEWTRELLALSPDALARFAEGGALEVGTLHVPSLAPGAEEWRGRRATDARFYVAGLLGLTTREQSELRRMPDERRGLSYLELAASLRGLKPEGQLARTLARVEGACTDLRELADLLRESETHVGTSPTGAREPARSFEDLVDVLDAVRADVEDDSADELFELAAGFEPGAVSSESLASAFDLRWLARILRWDDARLATWIASRRDARERRLDTMVLPRLLVRVGLAPEAERPERMLDEIACLWRPQVERDEEGRAPRWRDLDDLIVLGHVDGLFENVEWPRGLEVPEHVLPFQDPDLLEATVPAEDTATHEPAADASAGDAIDDGSVADTPWRVVGLVSDLAGHDAGGDDEPLREPLATEFWRRVGASPAEFESDAVRGEARRLVHALERRHAAAVDRILARLVVANAAAGRAGPPAFAEERVRRAENQEKYVQIDRGDRPLKLFGEPSYALVERLGRFPERYRGIAVRESTRRVQVERDADGEPIAGLLVGGVRKPMLREMLRQARDERRLAELRFMVVRSDDEDAELRELAQRVQGADEWTGGSGLEDYLDPELRGKPGWLQTEGLEESGRSSSASVVQAPTDGSDVRTTLDLALQRSAQHVITHPRLPSDPRTDRLWFASPVGAIVLLAPNGDVLAAASAPAVTGRAPTPGRGLESSLRRERTLRRPTFNPPGSVFKPFVAAYAIDRLGFDPRHEFECRDNGKGGGVFESMRCLGHHRSSDLTRALTVSCNAYFAQLGLVYEPSQFLDMAHLFGFDQPTGIRCFGGQGRSGLREDAAFPRDDAAMLGVLAGRSAHLQFANGLSVVEATPMQVARATCGLATGRLPDVRLVAQVGARAIEPRSRDLGLSPETLRVVHAAMRDVVESGEGSAHERGLGARDLGFSFACKTGSGDYAPFREGPELTPEDRASMQAGRMRKHTWVAGWFPAEDPVGILVVYLHDVSDTSSHTAVYVASQFLQESSVRTYVDAARRGEAGANGAPGGGGR